MMLKTIKSLGIFMMFLLATSCATKIDGFKISGTLNGIEEGTTLKLSLGSTHNIEAPIATTTYTKEGFVFIGKLDGPRLLLISVSGENVLGALSLMVQEGDIKVEATAKASERGTSKYYSFENVKVTGSPINETFLEKTAARGKLNKLYSDNEVKGKEILSAITEARNNKDQSKVAELQQSQSYLDLAKREKAFFDTVGVVMTNLILDNASTWWGPFLMLDQMSYFGEEQKLWWNQFSDEAKNSFYGVIVKEELFPEGFVGKPAPAFTVTGQDGVEQDLASLIDSKKYILIDFWASWCKPCRNEIPNFKKVYQMFSDKGFEIISISTDKNSEDWKKALKEEQLPWPNFLDNGSIADMYKVKFIPSTYLIDQNGTVVAEQIKGEELQKKLEELFK